MKKILILLLVICTLPLTSCRRDGEENTLYSIDAVFDGERTLKADMEVDYFNNTETEIKELKFNLFPNAFREDAKYRPVTAANEAKAYPNGVNYGGIDVLSCASEGEPVGFEIAGQDNNILVLSLKKGVFPGERAVVNVAFCVTLADCTLRLGRSNGFVNFGNWFPILCAHEEGGFYECGYSAIGDPFYSDVADFSVSLTVPGEYSVAAGGACDSTEVGEYNTTYCYTLKNARDFAFVLSKEFNVIAGKTGDIEVRFFYAECDDAESVVRAAERAIETYSELFGSYPYQSLTVALTDFIQGGMEYPSLVYVSDDLPLEDIITATVHEAAHQWWYAAVGNNQCEYAFLDEGLSEYSTVLFYENNSSYGLTREGLIDAKNREYHAFCGVSEQLSGEVSTVMERSLSGFLSEYEYVEIAYTKATLMLDGFRSSVGDARFFKGLKKYFEDNAFGFATPADLIAAFERAGGDAEGYFNSWISGKAVI